MFAMKKSLLTLAIGLMASSAMAQDQYPTRDIQLVVPYSAGGSVDAMARSFAKQFAQELDAAVVVQNRDGAGGTIGVGAVASSAAGGYTVLFSPSSPLTQAPYLLGKVLYDVENIQPICQIFENPFVIAVPENSEIMSVAQLLEAARAKPGAISYGHAGVGSVPHLATASLEQATDTQFNEIPFRGDAQVLPQILGGHVDFGSIGASNVAGRNLRVLAVLGKERMDAFPDAPAVSEIGVKNAVIARNGLYVLRDTPQPIKDRLASACQNASASSEFAESAANLSQQIRYMDSETFDKQLLSDQTTNKALIESLGLLGKQ